LNRLSPAVLEAYNQTTQAPYCAAYLSILATMYGSYIPALSEHHAGGVNVGRTVINGERLGGKKLPLLPGPHDHGLPRSRASGCDPGDELAAAPSQADRRSGGQAVGSIGITDRQSA